MTTLEIRHLVDRIAALEKTIVELREEIRNRPQTIIVNGAPQQVPVYIQPLPVVPQWPTPYFICGVTT